MFPNKGTEISDHTILWNMTFKEMLILCQFHLKFTVKRLGRKFRNSKKHLLPAPRNYSR